MTNYLQRLVNHCHCYQEFYWYRISAFLSFLQMDRISLRGSGTELNFSWCHNTIRLHSSIYLIFLFVSTHRISSRPETLNWFIFRDKICFCPEGNEPNWEKIMNALLQEALVGTQHIQHAAIIRRKDGAIKAKSANFNVFDWEFSHWL